jgi:transforming growth factor-beta-induced protein
MEKYDQADEPQQLTSFVGALYSNHQNLTLPSYLATAQDITIFVPNNIAFEIVRGAISSLSVSALDQLLSYHVVPGSGSHRPVYSFNFVNGTNLTTLTNQSLQIISIDNAYFVNSARILTSDLLISNGVMHVIDNVLSPNLTTAQPNPTSATQMPVLPTVSEI